jgi:anti-anti-sigma regulatory factor
VVVRLGGEHDLATVPLVQAALDHVPNTGSLIFDLAAVRFVDVGTMRVIMSAARGRSGVTVVVAPPDCAAARMLRYFGVGFDTVVSSLEEALAYVPGTVDR